MRRVSDAVIEAAQSLLGAAVKGDRGAARALGSVPTEAWPDHTMRAVADAIKDLSADGDLIELPMLLDKLARAEVSPSYVGNLSASPPTCQPERLAEIIRDEYIDHEQRRLYEMRAKGTLNTEELDSRLGALAPSTNQREGASMADWFQTEPEPIECLFEGRIPRGRACLLVAPGGRGKSLLVAGLVASVATGRALYPSFVPASPSRVLWWSSEDDADEIHRRVYRIAKAYRFTPEDEGRFVENVRLYATHGKPLLSLNCLPTSDYVWLLREVRDFKPHLIILDPLAHFNALDENNNGLMSLFMDRIIALSEVSGATILLPHHTSKMLENSGTSAAARGASAIRDHARVVLTLSEPTQSEVSAYGIMNPRLFVKADLPKVNNLPGFEASIFFQNVDGCWHEVDMTLRKEETAKAGRASLVRELARAIGENVENLTVNEIWHKPGGQAIREELANRLGKVSRDGIRNALHDAIDAGILTAEAVQKNGKPGLIPRISVKCPVNVPNSLDNSEDYE